MHSSELHHEYLWVYISAKNGSVFKTIPEIHRKKSTKMELLKFMFTLRYESKPKRNFFLGHPVVSLVYLLSTQSKVGDKWENQG